MSAHPTCPLCRTANIAAPQETSEGFARCWEHGVYRPRVAPDLSPAEAATVARFESAPDAEESLRERVARAMCESDNDGSWGDWPEHVHVVYRHYADAALKVMRGDDA